jgi:Family of unknown function (DUF6230)
MQGAAMPLSESVTSPRLGRVRWRRFGIIMVPAVLAAAVLITLTAKGAVAASFSVSGQQFTVTASSLKGTGFEQYGSAYKERDGKEVPVAVSVIRNATLSHMCQSVKVLGVTLRITAGGGSTPVTAQNLVVGATDLSGNATFSNISVGQDASTLNQAGATGQAGTFGQQASAVSITNVHQLAWSTTAGTFKLPGFHLQVGGASC